MADIVQLKNENGTPIYPVTTGEAINMAGGKTLDQVFADKMEALEQDYQDKKAALEADYQSKKAEIDGKAGFYNGDSPVVTSYPVGSIIMAQFRASGLTVINNRYYVWVNGAGGDAYASWSNDMKDLIDVGETYFLRPLDGTWRSRGSFEYDTDHHRIVLLQRVE